MIQPINRDSLFDVRLAEAMPARAAQVSTGVAEGQPSTSSQSMAQGVGGGALAVVAVLILLSALVALPGRLK